MSINDDLGSVLNTPDEDLREFGTEMGMSKEEIKELERINDEEMKAEKEQLKIEKTTISADESFNNILKEAAKNNPGYREQVEELAKQREAAETRIREESASSPMERLAGKWRTYEEPYDVFYADREDLEAARECTPVKYLGRNPQYYDSSYRCFNDRVEALRSEYKYATDAFNKELKEYFTLRERNFIKSSIERSGDLDPGQTWLQYLYANNLEIAEYRDPKTNDRLYQYNCDMETVSESLRKQYGLVKNGRR